MKYTHKVLATDNRDYLRCYEVAKIILLSNIPPQATDAELNALFSRVGVSWAVFLWPRGGDWQDCHLELGHKDKAEITKTSLNNVQLHGDTLTTGENPVLSDGSPTAAGSSVAVSEPSTATVDDPAPSTGGITTAPAHAHITSQKPNQTDVNAKDRASTSKDTRPTATNQIQESQPVRSWPPEWENQSLRDNEGVQAFYLSYKNSKAGANAGRNVPSWQASVNTGKDGRLGFRSCQYPSPDPMNKVDQGQIRVAVVNQPETEEGTKNPVSIDVAQLENLPTMETKGWDTWEHPQPPITKA
ncbi:hypothetical protein E8E14_008840 [Neopestalotiopsis sp. 37M]|nr:hypothetical protein E8E14_008840 [Neopestalotiopsis sp. 37M]